MKHTKHVLEKTQTDAFREFLELHSEVKIRQKKFESLKPFFLKQAKERDRRSSLYRKHVEMQIVFQSCMKYRKELVKKSANIDESFVIKSVTEAAEKTLCLLATNGQEKKIALVQKEAPPSELFGYFKELLVEYPRHSFMARWQREQLHSC